MQGLKFEFDRDVYIIKSEYDREKMDIDRAHTLECLELQQMIATIVEEEEAKLKQMKEEFDATREETKNKNVEELESMKHDLIKKIDDIDAEFQVQFSKYLFETGGKSEQYTNALSKNSEASRKINDMQRDIARLKAQQHYWSLKKQQQFRECKERNDALRKEKNIIIKHYHELKRKMTI